ncbi:MAG: hypothetical protein ACE5MI_03895 [Acidimicrobiia bacterium]
MNGKKQRNALTAVERALSALGNGDPQSARRAMERAVELDQLGIYESVCLAVDVAAADLDAGNEITAEHWESVAASLGPGPLAAKVDDLRR